MIKSIDKDSLIGYSAGIITGITYGLNPLFAVPLMDAGASVNSILLCRYTLSVLLLGLFLIVSRQGFAITRKQAIRLLILGILYTSSSICLFEAYKYIASGLATTLVFLYPVLVAVIMIFMKEYPTWQVWLSIILTFAGVLILTHSDSTQLIQTKGVVLALGSALVYAMFIVIVNRSRAIRTVSSTKLTFYSLMVGTFIFFGRALTDIDSVTTGIEDTSAWMNLIGLAILPTIVSTATLALATRKIGATKASVLGVFEPVTAILVGAIVFGEAVTLNIITGITLAMAAVIFMIVSSRK